MRHYRRHNEAIVWLESMATDKSEIMIRYWSACEGTQSLKGVDLRVGGRRHPADDSNTAKEKFCRRVAGRPRLRIEGRLTMGVQGALRSVCRASYRVKDCAMENTTPLLNIVLGAMKH